ncbi:MAG TPA: MCE family protein [Marmoricola sp.]|nr:MCE family protein [Marmoricola sp.]
MRTRQPTAHPHLRAGIIGAAIVVAIVLAALNAGSIRLYGSGTQTVRANFSDISELQAGDPVVMAGITVGQVTALTMGRGYVTVTAEVPAHIRFGSMTTAAIRVTDLLGSKDLELTSAGPGSLEGTIPVSRATPAYDLTTAFQNVTEKVEAINTGDLERALAAISTTFANSGPGVRAALSDMRQLTQTVAAHQSDLNSLLEQSQTLTDALASNRTQIAQLLQAASQLLTELNHRRDAIAGLIVHTNQMVKQISGLIDDNSSTLTPTLRDLAAVTTLLQSREKDLKATIANLAQFSRLFVNTIGAGPWFDSYIGNAPNSLKLEPPK